MRRATALVALMIGLATFTACGGDSSPMSGDAAAELRGRVTAVRSAVDTRDADAAERALDDLRAAVTRLRRSDGLSDARAADILAAAGAVENQLVTITTTTTTTTTTTIPPRTTSPRTTAPPATSPPATAPPATFAPVPDDHGNGKSDDKGNDDKKGGD
jgi:hypothetical protein